MVPGGASGNTIEDSVQVAKWLEQAGVDAIHVSTGGYFPHPGDPAGDLPIDDFVEGVRFHDFQWDAHLAQLELVRVEPTATIFHDESMKNRGDVIEGVDLADAEAIKAAVGVPVICTGGFQTASVIRAAIDASHCDAVSIARSLVANNDLVKQFAAGADRPAVPCTYCNKCLVNAVKNPLGCHEESRFASRVAMIAEIYSVFHPPEFQAAGGGA